MCYVITLGVEKEEVHSRLMIIAQLVPLSTEERGN